MTAFNKTEITNFTENSMFAALNFNHKSNRIRAIKKFQRKTHFD